MKFGQKIIIAFLMIILIMIIGVHLMLKKQHRFLKSYILNESLHFQQVIARAQTEELKALEIITDLVEEDKQVKELLSQKDKDALYDYFLSYFQKLKSDFSLTHFYFILPDGNCLLRMHDKDLSGDFIASRIFAECAEKNTHNSGLELGNSAFALRSVRPVYNKKDIIGYVEAAKEINNWLEFIYSIHPDKQMLLLADKRLLDGKKYSTAKLGQGVRNDWNDFDKYAVLSSSLGAEEFLSAKGLVLDFISNGLLDGKIFIRRIDFLEDRIFVVFSVMISGVVNKNSGRLIVFTDISDYVQAMNQEKLFAVLMIIGLGVLILFFGLLIMHAITNPLSQMVAITSRVANGDFNVHADIQSSDELGFLASSFNVMIDTLQKNMISIDRLNEEILHRKEIEIALRQETKRAKNYFDAAGIMFIALDKSGKIELINKKACQIMEVEPENAVGKDWFDNFIPLAVRDKMRKAYNDLINNEKSDYSSSQNVVLTGKNKLISVAWMNQLSRDDKGNVVGMLRSGEDVTARIEKDRALSVSESKYEKLANDMEQTQTATLNILEDLQEAKGTLEISRKNFLNIVEKSYDGVLIIDKEKNVRFANSRAEKIFGKSFGALAEKTFSLEFIKDQVHETTIWHDDGQHKIVEIRAVNTEWQEQLMDLVLLHDITERKKAEDSLRLSAQEWRVTFDSIGDGLALLDIDYKVVRCNKSLSNFVGLSYEQIIGQDIHLLIHDHDINGVCPVDMTAKTKKRSSCIIQSKEKWLAISVDPLIDENAEVVGFIYSVADITEQKQIELKLREYTDYVENIIETAQALIVGFDKELNVQSFNAFAEHTMGFSRQEVIGKQGVDLFIVPEYQLEMSQVLNNCLEGGRVKGYEVPVFTKDNKEIIISWDSAELKDGQGNIIGIVAMGYDVSQRKEIEKVQRLAQLGTLVSHMAHEVNNPLMVISGRAQLSLMEEIENKEIKDNLDIVMKECQRAKDIIQRLLRFSRPSKGEVKETDVNASVEEVVNLIEHQFGLGNVRITKEYEPDIPHVMVDEKQIHEVFMNLLTNARDAISGEGTIDIRTKRAGGLIRITFKDSGQGITKEVLDKIFDPFFTTKKKGTGLGLSICYSIIKAHNGDLRFESIPGKGTTAVIELPIMQEKEKNAEDLGGR